MTAIYIKNRLPSPKIDHKTPFEIVYKSKPSVKHMRVFGCRAFILTPREKRLKWDPKACEGMFMGYEEASKAYRVYDIEAGQVVISRDITFDESTFDFSMDRPSDDDEDAELDLDLLAINEDDVRQTVYKQTGKRKSEARPGMSRNDDQVLQKRCLMTKKMQACTIKMTTRRLQHFGVQVQTLWKQRT
uniref:Retroviral polymerase SH3-like domain-containing protein n=1 Tax=Peronospora matthiolae TaxID=2874970 RepID=A0AAV1VJ38_9STRA